MTETSNQLQTNRIITRRTFGKFVLAAISSALLAGCDQQENFSQPKSSVPAPRETVDPTAEFASRGYWRWNNETCDTGGRDLTGIEQVRFMPGVYEGNFVSLVDITVEVAGRSVTYGVIVPSNEQGEPILEVNNDIVVVIRQSIENTSHIMLSVGYELPKTFKLKNDVSGAEKDIVPIVLTPPRTLQTQFAIVNEGDAWSPNDLYAFGACIDDEGWAVQFDPNDEEVGERFRKVVNLEHPTEEHIADPRVMVMMAIAAAHEAMHSWQAEFPMFVGGAHRAFLRIDFEAFATWFGLFTQWDGREDLLPIYNGFLLDRAERKLIRISERKPYVEIDQGQRDYGGFIFWRGVQLLLKQVSRENGLGWGVEDIAIRMAMIHRAANMRVMDYLGYLGGATPEPNTNVQGIGADAYAEVMLEQFEMYGFKDAQALYIQAAMLGFVDFYMQDGWIENDLLEISEIDITDRDAVFSYENLDEVRGPLFIDVFGRYGRLEVVAEWEETQDIDPHARFGVMIIDNTGEVELLLPELVEVGKHREYRLQFDVPHGARVIVTADLDGSVKFSERGNYPDMLRIRRVPAEQTRLPVSTQFRHEPVFAATA